MNWLNKLERRLGRYAIQGLMRYIVIINGLVFLFTLVDPENKAIRSLMLDPALVLRGEVWRLVTFIFIPPSLSPIWILFVLYFYYTMGASLEHEWGSFKFNLFYLVGVIATALVAFVTGLGATSLYLNLSLFLAFAFVFPNYEILLFFFLPVKVKYLAILDWIFLGITLLFYPLPYKLMVIVALANYALFFGKETWEAILLRNQVSANRKRFFDEIANTPPRHRCTVCGKTEKTDPRLIFRVCKACDGDREYCEKHLEKHEHITPKN